MKRAAVVRADHVGVLQRLAPTGELSIAIHGLSKAYGGHAALDDVDLAVPGRVIYDLIGRTTRVRGSSCRSWWTCGLNGGTVDLAVPRQAAGVVVDTLQFESWLTARKADDLARHLSGDRVDAVLDELGLAEARDWCVAVVAGDVVAAGACRLALGTLRAVGRRSQPPLGHVAPAR